MTQPPSPETDHRATAEELVREAFGPDGPEVTAVTDILRGRGAFSEVLGVELDWGDRAGAVARPMPSRPRSVVCKVPAPGANGEAARTTGAYRREALAYRVVLPYSSIRHPVAHLVTESDDGACSLVLEDLTGQRTVDQLDGLEPVDAVAVAGALARFHREWTDPTRLSTLAVRHNTLAGLAPTALDAGLACLDTRWASEVDHNQRRAFADLVAARPGLVQRFEVAQPTLCHGDPRADNLVFERSSGSPIVFDWQQMAIQLAEADLAWLAATSLTVPSRRRVEADLVEAGGGTVDRYRLGLALPGLAVLLLAQRDLPTDRAHRLVAVSLQRIAAALDDNETASLGR